MRYTLIIVVFLSFWPEDAVGREFGPGRTTTNLAGTSITLFTYRPSGCAVLSLLFVFHGDSRTAEGYRDHARSLADRFCLVVFSPFFDKERFPR